MRILVHICCGPCGIAVLQRLLEVGHEVTGFFFNPNIHPLTEYMRRRAGAVQVAERLGVPLLLADELPADEQPWKDPWIPEKGSPLYAPGGKRAALPVAANPVLWLRAVSGREAERCRFCWRSRLGKCAEVARGRGFDAFSSSLLYSRHQDHACIRDLGLSLAATDGPAFVYEDFRLFWQRGVDLSREWGIYRQQYCGCLYSEYERYSREFW